MSLVKTIIPRVMFLLVFLGATFGLSACKISTQFDDENTSLRTGEARYTVVLTGHWSQANFPKNYPSNAHFSPMVLVNHSNQVEFWKMGQLATQGVEQLAETGQTKMFVQEINQQKSNGKAQNHIQLSALATGTSQASGTMIVSQNYPQITALSMLAPSPDWVVGINGINLFETNEWVKTKTIHLLAYDVGTQEGALFTSGNALTPFDIIEKLTSTQTNFNQGKHTDGTYVATLTFTLEAQK